MKHNTKTIIATLAVTLLCAAASHAQNWGGSYNSSFTGANGRTVSYNQSYNVGAGGWMGTGTPQGVGWAIFAINSLQAMRVGAPIQTPVAIGAGGGYGGGYYGGGCIPGGYYGSGGVYPGCSGGGGYANQPTFRAGWGVTPY